MKDSTLQTEERHYQKFSDLIAEKGYLYVVSTPIGNLEEISFRAIAILRSCDIIACEDTRHSGILMKRYGLKGRLISYYSNVESRKTDMIIQMLKEGRSCALISDAGTPCISDPGSMLVRACISEGIELRTIPGSSSLIHSLVVSGFPTGRFYFQGFLPQKKGRNSLLKELSRINMPIVIFESPFRINKTLFEAAEIFGNKSVSLSRELTKKFEQTIRGRLKDIAAANFPKKGEFVLIINNN